MAKQASRAELRFHDEKSQPFHRLPFIDDDPARPGLSFWSVPRTGGYGGGVRAGRALSLIYIKRLHEHGLAIDGGALPLIAEAMLCNSSPDGAEREALAGQIVGFFGELERRLAAAIRYTAHEIARFDENALLATANAAIREV